MKPSVSGRVHAVFRSHLLAASIKGTADSVGVSNRQFWDANLLLILDNSGQEIAARCEWGGVTMGRTVVSQRWHKVEIQRSVSLTQTFSVVTVGAMCPAALEAWVACWLPHCIEGCKATLSLLYFLCSQVIGAHWSKFLRDGRCDFQDLGAILDSDS